MKKFDFCIITPSYAPDFERCQLLCWSLDRFVTSWTNHYIIVDQRDLQLFRKLEGANRKIFTKESILPWWLKQIPFFKKKNLWFSLKCPPVRGWLIQQIIKLAIAQYVNNDVLVFVDSDVVFVRPFNLQNFIREGKVRLYREPDVIYKPDIAEAKTTMYTKWLQDTDRWYQTAISLLNLSNINYPAPDYEGQIITWKRDNVLQLYQHIKKISGKEWIEAICVASNLAEYLLYGIFVERVLKEQSGHYYDEKKISHDYWANAAMSDEQLHNFFTSIEPEHVAVMISAKAGMSIKRYEELIMAIS